MVIVVSATSALRGISRVNRLPSAAVAVSIPPPGPTTPVLVAVMSGITVTSSGRPPPAELSWRPTGVGAGCAGIAWQPPSAIATSTVPPNVRRRTFLFRKPPPQEQPDEVTGILRPVCSPHDALWSGADAPRQERRISWRHQLRFGIDDLPPGGVPPRNRSPMSRHIVADVSTHHTVE